MRINVAVMAGGESRRFKRDKTLEEFEGRPLIGHVVDSLSDVADEIVVVAKDCSKYEFLGINCLTDSYEAQCPMVGIATALKHFGSPCFVIAADTPFVNSEHVVKLFDMVENNDSVVPVINGKEHPLYSCYNVTLLETFERLIDSGDFALIRNLKRCNTLFINEDGILRSLDERVAFMNINTMEEYDKALKMYKGE